MGKLDLVAVYEDQAVRAVALVSSIGGLLVNASTVIAVCAVVIAAASLGVSVYEARATRMHNRRSVQPLLVLVGRYTIGARSGLWLTNSGLGPAKVTSSKVALDGAELGHFGMSNIDKSVPIDGMIDLDGLPFLETGFQEFLLSVVSYDVLQHREFYELIESRLRLEIHYDSVYGGEQFTAEYGQPLNP